MSIFKSNTRVLREIIILTPIYTVYIYIYIYIYILGVTTNSRRFNASIGIFRRSLIRLQISQLNIHRGVMILAIWGCSMSDFT